MLVAVCVCVCENQFDCIQVIVWVLLLWYETLLGYVSQKKSDIFIPFINFSKLWLLLEIILIILAALTLFYPIMKKRTRTYSSAANMPVQNVACQLEGCWTMLDSEVNYFKKRSQQTLSQVSMKTTSTILSSKKQTYTVCMDGHVQR